MTIEHSGQGLSAPIQSELQQAKVLLQTLGAEATTENITALIQFVQNNTTTIHARESDPYLPDAENIAEWEKLRPGTADEVMGLISTVVTQNRDDSRDINAMRRTTEKQGFNLSRLIAISCVPLAIGATMLGVPYQLGISIVVMGIGGPTAASFFSNWGGNSKS